MTHTPIHETCSSPAKTISQFFDLRENQKIAKILERCLLVGKKVPYKFPNDIASKFVEHSCRKLMTYVSPPKWPITRTAIAQRQEAQKKPPKILP